MSPQKVNLLGLPVDVLSAQRFLDELATWLGDDRTRRLCYTNAHVFNLAYRNERFRESLRSADLLLCEGFGGRIGSLVAGTDPAIPESLNTMTWIDDYLRMLEEKGSRLFIIGDEPVVIRECGRRMRENHPRLQLVGMHHGFFDRHGPDNDDLLACVAAVGTDVLIVGMGSPIQEFWIDDNLERIPATTILSLGGMFRWYSGAERPWADWMLRYHLGWLGRLVQHPIRHFRRYVIGNPLFLWRCLKQRFGMLP